MGSFLVNFHAQTAEAEPVMDALREFPAEQAWIAGPQEGWVSFWEAQASRQDSSRIQALAEHVSQSLNVPLIAFLVHDSDILCYWLYDNGEFLDEFNSCPGYWGDESIDEEPLEAACDVLVKYCRPGTDVANLEEALAQSKMADLAGGMLPEFVFVEQRLALIAPLLGLREELLCTDFNDIGREVTAEELGATWIGSGDPPDDEIPMFDDMEDFPSMMPAGPLHAAIMNNNIDEIEKLVAEGGDINEIPSGYTVSVLGLAASQSTPEILRKLVALGADLHKHGREGATPLKLAVTSGRAENIRTLVELGANLEERDPQFGSFLHLAILTQNAPDVIRLLLELGLDPEGTNAAGMTPLQAVQMQLGGLQQMQGMIPGDAEAILGPQIQKLEELERLLQAASGS